MRPTEELVQEHKAIKRMLLILEAASRQLEVEECVEPEHLEQMVEFIRVFADRCHHGKEEDLLFGAMEEAGIPREGGPIGVMLIEHEQGRRYVQGMAQAIAAYRAGDDSARSQFVENARGYVALLRQHIHKEDHILYPLAERHLSATKQAELAQAFARVEQERIGPGRHEAFHAMLDRFESIYLA